MRLIDADALMDKTDDKYSLGEIGRRERDDIVDALEFAPTIDAVEVGEYCDRLWRIAYERGKQDALDELMEYTYGMLDVEKFGLQHKIMSMMADRKTEPTISKMEQVDEPQTCSVNGRPYDCGNCEYHKCTADEHRRKGVANDMEADKGRTDCSSRDGGVE